MFVEESAWIRSVLEDLDLPTGAVVLDCGSQTADYRSHEQPYVEDNVIGPLRARGLEIVHLDAMDAPGVDIVQDITATDPDPATRIGRRFDLVICAGLLPNVSDPEPAVRNVAGPRRRERLAAVHGHRALPLRARPDRQHVAPVTAAARRRLPQRRPRSRSGSRRLAADRTTRAT